MVPGNGVGDCCGWITCAEYWSSPGGLSSSDSHGTGPISCHSHSEQDTLWIECMSIAHLTCVCVVSTHTCTCIGCMMQLST